jgi:hypothetical protein
MRRKGTAAPDRLRGDLAEVPAIMLRAAESVGAGPLAEHYRGELAGLAAGRAYRFLSGELPDEYTGLYPPGTPLVLGADNVLRLADR